jgi:hypothetical protein
MDGETATLKKTCTPGASVTEALPGEWRLEIPAGPGGKYCLAQLDDYTHLKRRSYPWKPPVKISLRARSSGKEIPGTWGFGLWNDPFGMAIIKGVELVRLPALPNCAWFFFASPENYLSLRNDLPASGALAATFRSPRIPTALMLLGAPALPLGLFKGGRRLLRRLGGRFVRQSAVPMEHDPTGWHSYQIDWRRERTILTVDDVTVLETTVSPLGPLGLVIWIDNQYAALRPDGSLGFGTLANEAGWIEVTAEF